MTIVIRSMTRRQLVINAGSPLLIEQRKRFKILVQGGADTAIGIVVAPFATRSRADLHTEPHKLSPEILKLRHTLRECAEGISIVGLNNGFPRIDDLGDLSS